VKAARVRFPGDLVVSLTLPAAGTYAVQAMITNTIGEGQSDGGDVWCMLLRDAAFGISPATGDNVAVGPLILPAAQTMTLSALTTVASGETVGVYCTEGVANTEVTAFGNLLATRVDEVN
jgi:hypothetical protein